MKSKTWVLTSYAKLGFMAEKEFTEIMRAQGWTWEPVRRARHAGGDYFGIGDGIGYHLGLGCWGVGQVTCTDPKGKLAQMHSMLFPPGTKKLVAVRVRHHAGDYWKVYDASVPPDSRGHVPYIRSNSNTQVLDRKLPKRAKRNKRGRK